MEDGITFNSLTVCKRRIDKSEYVDDSISGDCEGKYSFPKRYFFIDVMFFMFCYEIVLLYVDRYIPSVGYFPVFDIDETYWFGYPNGLAFAIFKTYSFFLFYILYVFRLLCLNWP